MKKILILGGAGFVGSHTADALLQQAHSVIVFDNLSKQVHATGFPSYISREAQFAHVDFCDLNALKKVVTRVDAIYHSAAAVRVGQSMYEISHYTATNIQSTDILLQ